MSKIFKKKRHFKFIKLKYIFLLLIIYISFDTTYSFLISKEASISNENILKFILSDANHNFSFSYTPSNIVNRAFSFLTSIDISNPISLLKGNSIENTTTNTIAAVDNENSTDDYNIDEQEKLTQYVKDPYSSTITNPKVYLYSSHQLETYSSTGLEGYNITPNVMMASYLLKEKLNGLGIPTIVNEFNLAEFIRANNWGHADSYKASRIFLLDAKSNYSSLAYFIDIHRDSVKKKQSTVTINGKNYAKILFIIGLENSNYKENLAVTESLNKKINKQYPGLSRGILKKEGPGVNGVYNQDTSPKTMLIEIGGYENTIEEVMCTTEALSKVLYDFIEGVE